MSIRERTMFTVVCDECGKDAFAEDESVAWSDAESAEFMVAEWHDWFIEDGKHLCWDHRKDFEDDDD